MYEGGGNRYSLFIMNPARVHFPKGKDITVDGRRICLTSDKGYNQAVWKANGLIYTLVTSEQFERLTEIAAAPRG